MSKQHGEQAHFDPLYGAKVYIHRGIAYPAVATPEYIRTLADFPMGADDVVVVGCPKSGTNWLSIVLANLYDHWETTKITNDRQIPDLCVPSMPAIRFHGIESCLAAPSPRLMKTHVPLDHMPVDFQRGYGRAIYITRNPKDVCDSQYNNHKLGGNEEFKDLDFGTQKDWQWSDHAEAFLRGTVYFGSWLDNVLGWHERDEAGGVLHLSYEEALLDTRRAVGRIVDFMALPVAPGAIDRVVKDTNFEAMKKNGLDKQYQPLMARREAKIGGWKKRFTVDQSERFDQAFGPALSARGIRVIYEP